MQEDLTRCVPGDLPGQWRQRAAFLTDYGDPNSARLWQTAAAELDEALKVHAEATLSLVEAAAVCGFTADYIGSLVRKGKIPNHGCKNAPRVRCGDLPSKASSSPGRPARRRRKGVGKKVTSITAKLSSRRQT